MCAAMRHGVIICRQRRHRNFIVSSFLHSIISSHRFFTILTNFLTSAPETFVRQPKLRRAACRPLDKAARPDVSCRQFDTEAKRQRREEYPVGRLHREFRWLRGNRKKTGEHGLGAAGANRHGKRPTGTPVTEDAFVGTLKGALREQGAKQGGTARFYPALTDIL